MLAKNLKEGDIIWGFPIITSTFDHPFLNCYYVKTVEEGLMCEGEEGDIYTRPILESPKEKIVSILYNPILNIEDTGLISFPSKFDLRTPIAIFYNDTEIWYYGCSDNKMSKYYKKLLDGKLKVNKLFNIFSGEWVKNTYF